jgi:hypothetical protein
MSRQTKSIPPWNLYYGTVCLWLHLFGSPVPSQVSCYRKGRRHTLFFCALYASLSLAIAGCATKREQATAEGVGGGAALGALLGAGVGALAGGGKGAPIGAGIGAAMGAAAGYSYAEHVKQRNAQLVQNEHDLDTQITFAKGANEDLQKVNSQIEQDLAAAQTAVNTLEAKIKRNQVTHAQLEKERQTLGSKVQNAKSQLQLATNDLNRVKVLRAEQSKKSPELDGQIARLEGQVAQLGISANRLASYEGAIQQSELLKPDGMASANEFPKFPWPPPQASSREVIPNDLLVAGQGQSILTDIQSSIVTALRRIGHTEFSYFDVPGGYALVTRLEKINLDGSPMSGLERWEVKVGPLHEWSLHALLRALFSANSGYYRIIVFVVTPQPFTFSNDNISEVTASHLVGEGSQKLPESIATRPLTPDYTCTALIYEFEQPTARSEPQFIESGRIPAHVHLEASGFFKALGG